MTEEVFELHMSPSQPFLPEHMKQGMELYIEHGIEPGGFMLSVLCNDLKGACARADHVNLKYLSNIVSYCYNNIPSNCWGSPERVDAWISKHREVNKS